MHNETIFLDFQATTPLDPRVLEAMLPWMSGAYNAHAIEHPIGRMAFDAVEEARSRVAALLGCEPSEITFTSGATEASNIALRGLTRPGANIVISTLEHASVLRTAYALESEGSTVRHIGVCGDGILLIGELQAELVSCPALASITAVNNEIGTIQPIEEAASICADHGVPLHSDLTQAVGRVPVNLSKSFGDVRVDFFPQDLRSTRHRSALRQKWSYSAATSLHRRRTGKWPQTRNPASCKLRRLRRCVRSGHSPA